MFVERENRYMGSRVFGIFPTTPVFHRLIILLANCDSDIPIGYKRTALPVGILWLRC